MGVCLELIRRVMVYVFEKKKKNAEEASDIFIVFIVEIFLIEYYCWRWFEMFIENNLNLRVAPWIVALMRLLKESSSQR